MDEEEFGFLFNFMSQCQFHVTMPDLRVNTIGLAPNVWLHSSVDRASHRYRGGHGFESRWSLDFFRLLLSNCLYWKSFNASSLCTIHTPISRHYRRVSGCRLYRTLDTRGFIFSCRETLQPTTPDCQSSNVATLSSINWLILQQFAVLLSVFFFIVSTSCT